MNFALKLTCVNIAAHSILTMKKATSCYKKRKKKMSLNVKRSPKKNYIYSLYQVSLWTFHADRKEVVKASSFAK